MNERSYLLSAKRHVDSSENRRFVRYNLTITFQLNGSSIPCEKNFTHKSLLDAEKTKIVEVNVRGVNNG